MKIGLAQINTTVGDLKQNRQKILEGIQSLSKDSDLIVFPELVLTGYPPQDLLLESQFIQAVDEELQSITAQVDKIPVILGTVRREDGHLYNSAAILQHGKCLGYRYKRLLPTYDVFDEDRYFDIANHSAPVDLEINGSIHKIGIEICEDLWDEAYQIDVTADLVKQGAQTIINISASPFSIDKISERYSLVDNKVNQLKCNFIYCNLVGAQDELVFDGGSFVVADNGITLAQAPQFNEAILVVDLNSDQSVERIGMGEDEQIFRALSLGVADYFRKTGHSESVIGLSGGIDSALTAAIAVDALGADHVTGVSMPSIFSSDHSVQDAKDLAGHLGIRFEVIPIRDINNELLRALDPFFSGTEAGIAEENIQARIRGNLLMAVANKYNALVLNTGNKTETALGYCTMYGDMCGALGVISDLNKLQVYSVSRWINAKSGKEVIPKNTIDKPPSAELKPDQVDPFDYDLISPLVDAIITEHKHLNKLVEEGYPEDQVKEMLRLIRLSEYKRRQAAPGIRISMKAFGVGRRYPIVNRFSN